MEQSSKPDIRESIERAEAQQLGVLSERIGLHSKLAVAASWITGVTLAAYMVLRWLFLGGTFNHPLFWRVLGIAEYVLAVLFSLTITLWIWFAIVRWREREKPVQRKQDSAD